MKVGDYVRFKTLSKEIKIGKVIEIIEPDKESMKKYCVYDLDNNEATVDDYIIKSSPNIIDLIEVGDYVNGVLVESIYQREKDKLYIHSFDTEIMMCFTNNNIETIVTKEMYSSVEYRVEND